MKGVIFTAVEKFVCDTWGEEAYEEILEECTLLSDEPFVGPGTYPDADLVAIATCAAARADISLPDALRAVGRFGFAHLASRVPDLVDRHDDVGDFLETLDSVIHAEVRKLYPEAETPTFEVVRKAPTELTLIYRSARKLCALMEGLLLGAGDHFDTEVGFQKTACMRDGAESCVYEVSLHPRVAGDV